MTDTTNKAYTRSDWSADYLRARFLNDERLNKLAEARDEESLGRIAEGKALRRQARELFRQYKALRAAADAKFFAEEK